MPAKLNLLSPGQINLLADLGERLRLARLRRGLSAEKAAAQAGICRMTLYRLERGEPALTIGTLIKVLGVMNMQASFAELVKEDIEGRQLQDQQLSDRRPPLRKRIRIDQYPQLKQLAWNIAPGYDLSPEEAFSLYERNWRHLDQEALSAKERALLRRLTRTVGHGVLLV